MTREITVRLSAEFTEVCNPEMTLDDLDAALDVLEGDLNYWTGTQETVWPDGIKVSMELID